MAQFIKPPRNDQEPDADYAARVDAARASFEEANKAASAPAPQAPAANSQAVQIKRTFSKTKDIIHDLFKLALAKCKKNISYQKEKLELVDVEHVHFYHTVDSFGTKQKYCSFVAGHTHEVSVQSNGNKEIVGINVGPALQERKRKVGDELITEFKEILFGENRNGKQYDKHTHEAEYIRSEKISVDVNVVD